MIIALPTVLLAVLLLALAGCATSSPPPARGSSAEAPRARCLSDPSETGTRPLIFLLCVQSP